MKRVILSLIAIALFGAQSLSATTAPHTFGPDSTIPVHPDHAQGGVFTYSTANVDAHMKLMTTAEAKNFWSIGQMTQFFGWLHGTDKHGELKNFHEKYLPLTVLITNKTNRTLFLSPQTFLKGEPALVDYNSLVQKMPSTLRYNLALPLAAAGIFVASVLHSTSVRNGNTPSVVLKNQILLAGTALLALWGIGEPMLNKRHAHSFIGKNWGPLVWAYIHKTKPQWIGMKMSNRLVDGNVTIPTGCSIEYFAILDREKLGTRTPQLSIEERFIEINEAATNPTPLAA